MKLLSIMKQIISNPDKKTNSRQVLLMEFTKFLLMEYLASLHDQNKCGFFWRAGFYLANQGNMKSIQKALIGWKKKAGPPNKKHFCFDHVNRLTVIHT